MLATFYGFLSLRGMSNLRPYLYKIKIYLYIYFFSWFFEFILISRNKLIVIWFCITLLRSLCAERLKCIARNNCDLWLTLRTEPSLYIRQ